ARRSHARHSPHVRGVVPDHHYRGWIVRGDGCPVPARTVELARKRNRSGDVTSLLIENATGIFTGLHGAAMRTSGLLRIRDGVIAASGALQAEPDERRLDARGGV